MAEVLKVFRQILVPVSRSLRARPAVEVAVELAAEQGGRVTLLHVIETIKDTNFEEFEAFYQTLARQAETAMAELTQPYAEEQVEIDREIVYGGRVEEILRFAEERDVDLIVMQSHRVDPSDPRRGWSTISYQVGILARCPVLLVK